MHLQKLNHTYLYIQSVNILSVCMPDASQVSKNFRGTPKWIRSIEHFHSVRRSPVMRGTLAMAGSLVTEKTPFNQTQRRQVPPTVIRYFHAPKKVSQQEIWHLLEFPELYHFGNSPVCIFFWYFWWLSMSVTTLKSSAYRSPRKLVINPPLVWWSS